MKNSIAQLRGNLSKNLSPIYIICGDEILLVEEALDLVCKAAKKQGFHERATFEPKLNIDWEQLHLETNTQSLFNEKKILIVRIPDGKPAIFGAEILIEISSKKHPDNLLLIILPKLDKPIRSSRWFKTISNNGSVTEISSIQPEEMCKWIKTRLTLEKIHADQIAIQTLADRVEGNLLAAAQEIEKIKLSAPRGPIDETFMMSLVSESARYSTAELTKNIFFGEAKIVHKILKRLREEGTKPLPILGSIIWNLRALLAASERQKNGATAEISLRKSGVWEQNIGMMRSALDRISPAKLRMLLYQAGAIDRGEKGLRDAMVWDELMVFALSLAGSSTLTPKNIKILVDN
ncbi:MAG: DNA polymerase III subunit delta [Porticoccaceae bacterium]|nr:DNA polymerase III subunit delta [Porticoccaceae bacterium]|tara:strand:- start:1714 stop:2760 length:1047 start_codon:yes stop_codon:yes gene_type:complete